MELANWAQCCPDTMISLKALRAELVRIEAQLSVIEASTDRAAIESSIARLQVEINALRASVDDLARLTQE